MCGVKNSVVQAALTRSRAESKTLAKNTISDNNIPRKGILLTMVLVLSLFSHCSNDTLHFFTLLLSTSVSSKLEWQIRLSKEEVFILIEKHDFSLHTNILPSFWQISKLFCPCRFWATPYTVSHMEQIQRLPAQDHGWIWPFCCLPEKINATVLSKNIYQCKSFISTTFTIVQEF